MKLPSRRIDYFKTNKKVRKLISSKTAILLVKIIGQNNFGTQTSLKFFKALCISEVNIFIQFNNILI